MSLLFKWRGRKRVRPLEDIASLVVRSSNLAISRYLLKPLRLPETCKALIAAHCSYPTAIATVLDPTYPTQAERGFSARL